MPQLTRYFIKTALIYLAFSLILGTLLAARPTLNLPDEITALSPVFFHLFMVGWIAQLIFGMMFWMLPKYSRDLPRGHERVAWSAYWLINSGLLLRAFAEPLTALRPESGVGWLLGLSALLQLCGGWAFIVSVWPRVKER